MTAIHAGIICTLLLIAASAGMLGCMNAARRHRRFAFALCALPALADFVSLAVLLSRLPACETLPGTPWTAAALLLTILSLVTTCVLLCGSRRQLSPVSIKESCDHLPCALCFAWENGQPCLTNLKWTSSATRLPERRC